MYFIWLLTNTKLYIFVTFCLLPKTSKLTFWNSFPKLTIETLLMLILMKIECGPKFQKKHGPLEMCASCWIPKACIKTLCRVESEFGDLLHSKMKQTNHKTNHVATQSAYSTYAMWTSIVEHLLNTFSINSIKKS